MLRPGHAPNSPSADSPRRETPATPPDTRPGDVCRRALATPLARACLLLAMAVLPQAALADWQNVGSAGISPGKATNNSIAIAPSPDGAPYLAFVSPDDGAKLAVMRFDGSSWVNVGGASFASDALGSSLTLAFAGDGTAYVAYQDGANGSKATVMKFNGTNWVVVGGAGFSAGTAQAVSLAVAPDGTPYVGFKDGANSSKASVMKFDGSNWVAVGAAGFSAGIANSSSLAIASDGTPYLAYIDGGNSSKASVMKFDGSNWVLVGGAGFSATGITEISLALAAGNTPYVVYQSLGSGFADTVMTFDGTSWATVGSSPLNGNSSGYPKIAIAPDGTLYVGYQDDASGGKASVMKFDGGAWLTVGSAGFSASYINNPSLAVDANGTVYIAYRDNSVSEKATVMRFTAAPLAISSAPAGSPSATATGMSFTVLFSEAVSGVDAGDFTLTATGTAAGTIGVPTSSDNITWTVPISGISGAGTLRLDLNASGTGIAATAAGNTAIGTGFNSGTPHAVNVPAAVNAVCGTVAATSFQPTSGLCAVGTLNAAGVIRGGGAWTWACDGGGSGTSTAANACSAAFAATATSSGGGAGEVAATNGWVFAPSGTGVNQTSGFIPTTGHVKSPPSLPPGYTFPHGLFDFVLNTGAAGSAATVTITYPAPLPAGSVYWKYGPTAGNPAPHWYQFPGATIAGNTVTLTITDGGLGDDDMNATNSVIVDVGGPGAPGGVSDIPTLSEWGMIALSALLGLCGFTGLRRRGNGLAA